MRPDSGVTESRHKRVVVYMGDEERFGYSGRCLSGSSIPVSVPADAQSGRPANPKEFSSWQGGPTGSRSNHRPWTSPKMTVVLVEADAVAGRGEVPHQQKPSSARCMLSRSSCAFWVHRQVCPPPGDSGIHGS